ncbi:MAG: hypothetical protein HFI46_06190 [Lachnospiraceae bacterium]|nr:hypothetical protein [Lachnospiraceae bacterium]
MKQGRVAGMVIAGINVILIIVCVVLYFRTDRIAPHFEFQALSVRYREGMDQSELLAGITARDNVDGDITDRVVIEKMIEDTQDGSVVVFYAVSDRAGNVAKTSRVFEAVFDDQSAGRYMEAGIDAALQMEHMTIDYERGKDGQDEGETEIMPSPSPLSSITPSPLSEPALDPTSTPALDPTSAATPLESTSGREAVRPSEQPVPTANPAAPVLTLKTSEIRVRAGQGPAWVDIIETLTDDKDSYETLFRNLSVSSYDRDRAGSYRVTVCTQDSDGNRSQSVPLTILVE